MKSLSNSLAKGILLFTMGLGIILVPAGPAFAVLNITATGSWTQSIDKNNLTGGPGTDLTNTFTSAQNTTLITITGTTSKRDNWQINIKRINTTWAGSLLVFAQRTSNGTGTGTISGGQAYIQVTTNDTTFFTGAGNRNGVQIQLQLTGASLTVPPNQYSTTIQYTIIDTP
jgi:hypothetical protein